MRDYQRQRVYIAEHDAFHRIDAGPPYPDDLTELRRRISVITTSSWWARQGGSPVPAERIDLRDGRGTSWARGGGGISPTRGGWAYLNLPRWARKREVVLHELAHVLVDHQRANGRIRGAVAAHGRHFTRAMLALVGRWVSVDAARTLRAAYRERGARATGTDQDHLSRIRRRRARPMIERIDDPAAADRAVKRREFLRRMEAGKRAKAARAAAARRGDDR